MDETSIFTVLASVVTTLGSSNAWEFYSKRTEDRRIEKEEKMNDQKMNIVVAYRDPGDNSRKKQLDLFVQQMKLIFHKDL